MKLYEECLNEVEKLLGKYQNRSLTYKKACWPDAGKNQLLFQKDTAYELGKDTMPAISGVITTDNKEHVEADEIRLIGRDLPELTEDSPVARIAFVRTKQDGMEDNDAKYREIRKIEYVRYHVNPLGYMMRISTLNQREAVRVGKEALKEGLDFSKVGSLFIDAYHECPSVEAVKLFFITESDFPYEGLEKIMEKSENITKALDHLLKKVKMDCDVCKLKEVCAEVEALMET